MVLLSKMMREHKFLLLISICISGLTATITLWWNMHLSKIINTVSVGISPSKEMVWGALVTMLIMGVTNYIKSYITGYTCEGMTHDLRMGYARHLSSLPITDVEDLNAGEQISKLQNEIAGVSGYLNGNLFQLFDDIVRFLSTLIWLLFISPTLTLASNLPAFIIMVYVFWSSKIIGSATERSQTAKGQMNQYADMLLALFPIIRLYDAARITLNGYTRCKVNVRFPARLSSISRSL
jgi:ABC-type multidrug transport system fused ATPase/permease subunit